MPRSFAFVFFLLSLILGGPPLARAAGEAPSCADLAEMAGAAQGIPPGLMAAISLVETGRNGQPWPWTLNEGGKGMHFATRPEALSYLQGAIERGVRNIDVGCMQLNLRWHNAGFASADAMLDPVENTRYAALFLAELYRRLGSWEAATRHYHSTDKTRGAAYLDKVVAAAGAMPPGDGADRVAPRAELLSGAVPRGMATRAPAPLIALGGDDRGYDALMAAAAGVAASGMALPVARPPDKTLHAKDALSPRLRWRWQAVLAARQALGGGQPGR